MELYSAVSFRISHMVLLCSVHIRTYLFICLSCTGSSSSNDDNNIGAIIGAAVGGIVGVILITLLLLVILWCCYKKYKRNDKSGKVTYTISVIYRVSFI